MKQRGPLPSSQARKFASLCQPGIRFLASSGKTPETEWPCDMLAKNTWDKCALLWSPFRGDEVARPHSEEVAELGTEPRQSGSRAQYLTPLPQPGITSNHFPERDWSPLPCPLHAFAFYITVCDAFQILQQTPGCLFQRGLICGEAEPQISCYRLIGFPSLRNYNTHGATRQGFAWLRKYLPIAFWEL